ncbi:ed73535c-5391-4c99-b321-4a70b234619a-CDS [Sclerotinia trifoliorum]|uniref:Anaphase-promoting complex subunit 11 n=1 Tax=Sclerotinia trifoliorum TaxID=28548 RepID=A0A8H2ZRH4_9HELO|nr:ed73535c-5391-4c99-b321-4a70b234619a-CDS [Sclerotinia trifoliorum]
MPYGEGSGSDPADPDYIEYQGAAEDAADPVELSDSVYDGDLSGDLTDDEHQDSELSERLEQEISDYFSRNTMNRQHIFEAFRIYESILLEHHGRSTSRETRATGSREQVDGFSDIFMSSLGHFINPEINLGTRDQAIDNLLIPAPADETQAESEVCPICNEIFDATTEDGKSLANHEAYMLPDCKHIFGRKCIDKWLKGEEKNTCPMCRAKVELPSSHASNTFSALGDLTAGVDR